MLTDIHGTSTRTRKEVQVSTARPAGGDAPPPCPGGRCSEYAFEGVCDISQHVGGVWGKGNGMKNEVSLRERSRLGSGRARRCSASLRAPRCKHAACVTSAHVTCAT
ncbi:hypothetical protein EVAR_4458_1 [Eumeta japonica]|uniref:Uncharacterized protein n=1 Tax=Eumeta variegata TaxID=151549 RepID=A0A4C1SXW3_EUMVA|nr:hypothetical protein EVAR_4458_1 [Eumeta japonica]